MYVAKLERRRVKHGSGVLAAQVRRYSVQDSQLDSYNMKYFQFAVKTLHMNATDACCTFVHEFGISQNLKIKKEFTSMAIVDKRLQSFTEYSKNMMQADINLCDTGLFYARTDNDNGHIVCYCCGDKFIDWQQNINPWVQHALRSPECPLLQLYKAKPFVKYVHDTYNYIRNSHSIPDFQSIIHDFEYNFGEWDSPLEIAKRRQYKCNAQYNCLAMFDTKIRYHRIAKIVSEIMNQAFPDLIGPVIIDLNKKPLPIGITCKVCFTQKMEVCFIPCGHLFACIQCAVCLTHCSICRVSFSSSTFAMRVFIEEEDDTEESSTSSYSDNLCRKCHKQNINAVFIPCRHAHICINCAITEKNCPVCLQQYVGIMEVYI